MNKSKCGCGATVLWVQTTAGKKMPIDIQERYVSEFGTGDKLTLVTLDGAVVSARECARSAEGAVAGRQSHFATCPQASTYRRAR